MIKLHKNLTTPGPPFLRNLPSLVAMMITHGNVILHILLKNLMCAHVAKLAFLHIGSGGRPIGKVIITKEICITIDFAPPPKKKQFLEESQNVSSTYHVKTKENVFWDCSRSNTKDKDL